MLWARRPGWQKHKVAPDGKGLAPAIAAAWASLWSIAGIDTRPMLFGFAVCAGAVAYFIQPSEPALLTCIAATFATAVVFAMSRWIWWLAAASLPALLLLGGCAGFTAGAVRAVTVAAPVIRSETRPLMLEGWVKEVEPGEKGARLRIETHAMSGYSPAETPRYVRVTHKLSLNVAPGRFVRCYVVLRPPPSPSLPGDYDFRRQAWFEQLGAVGYVMGRCRGGALGAPQGAGAQIALRISSFRRRLAEHVTQAAGDRAGGFAAALVSGDRSFMKTDDQEALRGSGLSHLLAISGLHMAMVGGLVFLIVRKALALIEPLALRVAVQKPAAVAALVASLAYLIISGASVSTQRAFIMSAVVFGAVLADRAALSLRSYAIAMILVVLFQPESVMTPGFQMSFAASGALIATYDAWTRRRSEQERVLGAASYTWASLFMTSLVAGTATAPFAIYHFDRLAGFGLLANLLAMPVITFISAPLAALSLILTPFGFGDVGLRLFGLSLETVLAIAHWCSDLPAAAVTLPRMMPATTLALAAAAIALAMAARGSARVALAALALIPAVIFWYRAPDVIVHWAPSGDLFVREQTGYLVRYELEDGDGLAPLRYANIPPGTSCSGSGCEMPVPSGAAAIRVSADGETSIEISGETRMIALTWPETERAGGITILSGPAGLYEVRPPACGNRPWRGCDQS